jgi:integral membrane protein
VERDETVLKSYAIFRIIGFAEGISFLLLLGIAMPLKYFADYPEAVAVVGMLHGVLFVLYVIAILWMTMLHRWSFWRMVGAMLSSVLPFGPFIFDKSLHKNI